MIIRPAKPKRDLIEERLRNARGIADTTLTTDETMGLTRDPNRYRDYVPHVRLIAPTGS